MKKLLMFMLITILTLIAAACGTAEEDGKENTEASDTNESTAEETESEVVTITHELGETDVEKNPEKVVVFDFGSLDTLDKLGIEVAGVPQKIIPEYLDKYAGEEYENVGSLKEPDFEKIAEIDPDLIIISGRQSDLYDQLTELGPTVYLGIDTTRYMDSFKENATKIGKIFEKEAEVEEELTAIDESIAALQETAEENGENALIILANDDKISAYGPNSRFGIIHDVFGIPAVDEGIEVSTHGMNVSFEYVTENDPDLLYVIDRGAAIGGESSAKQIVENKMTNDTKAYKNDNIVYLNPEFWYLSGGGLVSVSGMLDEVENSLQ
ncbi:siderophore ABC transporter substrate-binding protein [Virgibacillus sp. W0181]|uniref:siderophore ABC transporter substrate-binding protein n=1 Tax=Virgibacillus sp. W0181 TaxID=3391581 RepID=UPI003F48BA50